MKMSGQSSWRIRWDRVAAAGAITFLVLLASALGAMLYVEAMKGARDQDLWNKLSELGGAIDNDGLQAVQDDVSMIFSRTELVALLVADNQGVIVAAEPEKAIGRQLPMTREYWVQLAGGQDGYVEVPTVDLFDYGGPSAFGEFLGVTGEPQWEYRLKTRRVQRSAPEGEQGPGGLVAHIFAVVSYPTLVGLSLGRWVVILAQAVVLLFLAYALALPAWVFFDARRRNVDAPLAWAALTLVTNAIGWATYLVVRGWQRPACPNCGRALRVTFRACPHCGVQVRRACPSCGQVVNDQWSFCPHCTEALN